MTAWVLEIFFDSQPLALEHVQEVGVAAEIELVGAVEPDAALAEQVGQHAVDDGRADLALDVVADDAAGRAPRSAARQSGFEAMNTGMQLTKAQPASSACSAYHSVGLLRADRQVGDEHVGAGLLRASRRHVERVVRLFDRPRAR